MENERPRRLMLPDFSGKLFSLDDSAASWECLGTGRDLLLLGTGPGNPEALPFVQKARGEKRRIFWLDCPDILNSLAARGAGRALMPADVEEIDADESVRLAADAQIYFYRPGLLLAPDWWGPILGKIMAAAVGMAGRHAYASQRTPWVILPGGAHQLLHMELQNALEQCGIRPVGLDTVDRPQDFPGFLKSREKENGSLPEFFLSVNLRGLDAGGMVFSLCRALGIGVALWFVDNPWHLLSSLRLPWWKKAHIFVTDATFIAPLQDEGAENVFFLPLAYAWHMWRPLERKADLGAPLFVGRASFPEKTRFFAAARISQELQEEARRLLNTSGNPNNAPNFHWWMRKLKISPWPGNGVRAAGLGAENCSLENRIRWLKAGLEHGLEIVGGAEWKERLPGCQPLPVVDYYGDLPQIYSRAASVLNVTSLLLPGSLSQRHFDVWAAGGYLLSDATSGLNIFPEYLTQAITLACPHALPEAMTRIGENSRENWEIRQAWRDELRKGHSYIHRIREICARLRIDIEGIYNDCDMRRRGVAR